MSEATLPTNRMRIAAALGASASAGMLMPDIAVALGVSKSSLWAPLDGLVDKGVVAWWPDPHGKAANRRRYWLASMRPAEAPKPSGLSLKDQRAMPAVATPIRRADGVLEVPSQPFYSRHQLTRLPPGYESPLNPAECRPWAACAVRSA